MAVTVAEGKSIIVLVWFREVKRAGCCIIAVPGSEEVGDILRLNLAVSHEQTGRKQGTHRKDYIVEKQNLVKLDAFLRKLC